MGGLNFNTDEQALEDLFSSSGPISDMVIVKDRETQQSWSFGFITNNAERASDAMRAMNRESLDGHQIQVDHAGRLAPETRGGAFGAHRCGHSYSRGGGDRTMGVAGVTVDLEEMDMDMEGPETMVAEARVVMTATQEEIMETIMTAETRHAHLM
ncbi:hypothetical protein HPG69_017387 [Diceros bicornis minor]|uniref:RRM domain-containing protein n=1 Tax=Diceros bicornis minor TaxID=77932 RepID=A0A7J7ENW5_DICBM|nr:hypothetical protein HPG69_017387 [Diceros bicornis minor]